MVYEDNTQAAETQLTLKPKQKKQTTIPELTAVYDRWPGFTGAYYYPVPAQGVSYGMLMECYIYKR